MWPLLLINLVPRSMIHLQFFEILFKKMRSSVTGNMDNIILLSSSDSVMKSKKKKNFRATFKIQIKNIVYLLKQRSMHCLRLGQKYLRLY